MTSIPGEQYINYDRTNPRWREDNGETGQIDWARDHYIDPTTGELVGDFGYVPWKFGRAYQAEHDRAMWAYRNRLMDQGRGRIADARRFQQGAMGLLQSWRPGGGAALEAGIHNQVAGGMRAEGAAYFQQAQQTQNLDLMEDTRVHDRGEASARANRQFNRAQTTALISAVLGAGVQNSASISRGEGQTASNNASYSNTTGGTDGGGTAAAVTDNGGDGVAASQLAPEGDYGGATAAAGLTDSSQQPGGGGQAQPAQMGSPFATTTQQNQTAPATQQVDPMQPLGPPGTGVGGGGAATDGPPGGGGVQGQQQPVAAFASPMAGADGNFSADAFAASAAMRGMGGPVDTLTGIDLNHFLADLIEEDPFYKTLPNFIMNEWRKRQEVGAA